MCCQRVPSAFVRGSPDLDIYHAEYILHRISPAVPRRTYILSDRRIADPPVPSAGGRVHSSLLLRMDLRITQSPDCACAVQRIAWRTGHRLMQLRNKRNVRSGIGKLNEQEHCSVQLSLNMRHSLSTFRFLPGMIKIQNGSQSAC